MNINPFKKIKELESKIKLLESSQANPTKVIESIIGRGISWYDYKKLNHQQRSDYYGEAQIVLNNEVFNNELMHYMKDLLEQAALKTDNFEQVLNIRTGFVTLETLKKRLTEIENPNEIIPKDNIFDPI